MIWNDSMISVRDRGWGFSVLLNIRKKQRNKGRNWYLKFLSVVEYLRILIPKSIKKTKPWKVCKGWDMLEKTDRWLARMTSYWS